MTTHCAECGVSLLDEKTCQSIFDECLMLEYLHPEAFGRVHMLLVACFMIQHERYSDEALIWIEEQLRAHLEQGVSVQHIRRRTSQEAKSGTRTWKITRPEGAAALPKVAWSVTIADIVPALQDAEHYCQEVERWARATLREMPQLTSGR